MMGKAKILEDYQKHLFTTLFSQFRIYLNYKYLIHTQIKTYVAKEQSI